MAGSGTRSGASRLAGGKMMTNVKGTVNRRIANQYGRLTPTNQFQLRRAA